MFDTLKHIWGITFWNRALFFQIYILKYTARKEIDRSFQRPILFQNLEKKKKYTLRKNYAIELKKNINTLSVIMFLLTPKIIEIRLLEWISYI